MASREVVHVLEVAIDRGEADVGHLVELLQLAHHQFAELLRCALRARRRAAAFPRYRSTAASTDSGRDRPLAQGQHRGWRAACRGRTRYAAAVLLDHLRQLHFRPFVGGEALVAGSAAPAAANDVTLLVDAGIDDRRVLGAAEWAFHPALRLRTPETSCTISATSGPHLCDNRFVVRRFEHVGDQMGDRLGLDFREAARGHRRRADADAAGDERLLRIVGDGVLVDRDVGACRARPRLPCR